VNRSHMRFHKLGRVAFEWASLERAATFVRLHPIHLPCPSWEDGQAGLLVGQVSREQHEQLPSGPTMLLRQHFLQNATRLRIHHPMRCHAASPRMSARAEGTLRFTMLRATSTRVAADHRIEMFICVTLTWYCSVPTSVH
jgi:hypothetical protein